MSNTSARPAFFFDRDGVVNRSPGKGYVLCKEDFFFNEGVIDLLAFLKQKGFLLIVVTSQQGVGKGLMSQADLDAIHESMQEQLANHQAAFDAIYSCTCLASDPSCKCRKPSEEMITKATEKFEIDLSRSWLIGDHDRDIQMAINAGVPNTIRVLGDDHPTAGVLATKTVSEVSAVLPILAQIF